MKHDPREIRFAQVRTLLISHFYRKVIQIAERAGVTVSKISGDIYRDSGFLQPDTLQDQKIGVWGAFRNSNFRELEFEMSITHARRWIPVTIVWLEGWKRARTFVVNRDIRITIGQIEGELLELALRCAKLPKRYEVSCSTGSYVFDEDDPRLHQLLRTNKWENVRFGEGV